MQTWSLGSRAHQRNRSYALSVYLLISGIALAVSVNSQTQLALDCIFSFALVSNGGSVPLLLGIAVNLGTFIAAEVFAFAFMGYSFWMNSFWMLCGFVFITLACASTEYYIRRRCVYNSPHCTGCVRSSLSLFPPCRFALQFLTQVEMDIANGLLYKMLPVAIVDQLKEGGTVVSDYFEGVSILFCDIKGFTTISARIPPEEVVELLNNLFSRLDMITDKYKV